MAVVGFACEPPPDFSVSPLCGEGRITASSMQKTDFVLLESCRSEEKKKNNNRKFSSLVVNCVAHKL